MKNKNKIIENTSMLLLLNIAKLVFPFFTLPYLTRIMSTDCYGVVTYVKAVMTYMQVIVDFGFTLSATKSVVEHRDNNDELERIIGTNILAKIILAMGAFFVLLVMSFLIPILRNNKLFTYLSFGVVFQTIFLFDFFFRGIEKMHIITIRFVIMKGISTLLTFLVVKGDSDLLLIPILDLIGSGIAIVWVYFEIKKIGLRIKVSKIRDSIAAIKESAIYFLSNVASTSFNVFNTVVAGIVLSSTEIAYWGVCMQIINAVQAMYMPISDAIYPEMIKSKNINLIKKIVKIFAPVLVLGCVLFFVFGEYGLLIVGGERYISATSTLHGLIPVLFFGFFAVIFGWPSLGAIGKVKENSLTTVVASLFQIAAVVILVVIGRVTLLSLAIIRSMAEIILFLMRFYYFQYYKSEFNDNV